MTDSIKPIKPLTNSVPTRSSTKNKDNNNEDKHEPDDKNSPKQSDKNNRPHQGLLDEYI